MQRQPHNASSVELEDVNASIQQHSQHQHHNNNSTSATRMSIDSRASIDSQSPPLLAGFSHEDTIDTKASNWFIAKRFFKQFCPSIAKLFAKRGGNHSNSTTSSNSNTATSSTKLEDKWWSILIPGFGIWQDLKRRLPWYLHDYKDGLHLKCLLTVTFVFFTNVLPGISLGNFLHGKTNAQQGIMEVLLATFLCNLMFSILGGQPLLILGVTGPVSLFNAAIYQISVSAGIPFLPWLCVIGLWSSVMHILLAVTNVMYTMKYVSRFVIEIFAVLTGIIFIYSAVEEWIDAMLGTSQSQAATLLNILLSYVYPYDHSCFKLLILIFYLLFSTVYASLLFRFGSTMHQVGTYFASGLIRYYSLILSLLPSLYFHS